MFEVYDRKGEEIGYYEEVEYGDLVDRKVCVGFDCE